MAFGPETINFLSMAGPLAPIFHFRSVTMCAIAMSIPAALASVSDMFVPEEWSHAKEFTLSDSASATADAQAHYMLAIFKEENEGPDSSIASKLRVLHHDPGFSSLAIDVAQHHLRRGNSAEALAVLKDAATANPRDHSPLLVVASIYLHHLDKPALAEKYALRLRKTAPENTDAIQLLCEIYHASGKSTRIDSLLDSASKSTSKDPAYWIALAETSLRELSRSRQEPSQKNRDTTLELAKKAVALGNTNSSILAAAGDIFALIQKPGDAIEAYKQAIDHGATPGTVQEKLANCLLETGDKEAAVGLLEDIVAQNPLNLRAYDQLAGIHLERKNFASAVANMRQAMRLAPLNPVRFEELIRAALLAEDHSTAIQFSTEAEQRFPYLTGFTVLRAVSLSQAEDHHSAMAAFERALVKAPNTNPELLDSAFYMSYGAAAERAGHYTKAAELLKKSIALDPAGAAEACNYLGYMWADRNEHLEEAEALVRRALELDPENAAYRDSLGWVFHRQGRYELALAELLRAAEACHPPDAVILEHVGDTLEKLNRSAEALQYWQKALQIDPANTSLAVKIDQLTRPVARQPEPARPPGNR